MTDLTRREADEVQRACMEVCLTAAGLAGKTDRQATVSRLEAAEAMAEIDARLRGLRAYLSRSEDARSPEPPALGGYQPGPASVHIPGIRPGSRAENEALKEGSCSCGSPLHSRPGRDWQLRDDPDIARLHGGGEL